MSTPVLVTKLFIPATRPELVLRPRLSERLDESLNQKLTLISAPAGFGKTTLVAEWVNSFRKKKNESQEDFRIAWLSLDKGDNDLTRFLTYFITALNQANGSETALGNGALNMLQAPQPPPIENTLTSLINEIAIVPDKIIFILDDYHLIDTQAIHEALSFLLENLPPTLHLIIATREDPLLQLSRLRARGQLVELRATDLRFTSAEAADFLNQAMGLALSVKDIAALEMRTEGWIAGLQLAAISMQGYADVSTFVKSFTGSHRLVLDYLIEEVLGQQPESIQNFLLQTSILDRLTGSLCDALTGLDNGQQVLETLERANLFIIPLDEERRWYRYHHLFADLLRQQLRQNHVKQVSLHQRAGKWYEQNGFVDEAIEHSLQANEFDRAANLIENYIDAIWGRGNHRKLKRWLDSLPEAVLFSKPYINIYLARYLCNIGQFDAAKQTLEVVEQALNLGTHSVKSSDFQKQVEVKDSDRIKLQGRIAATKAVLGSFQGDVRGMIEHSHQALEILPKDDLAWRGLTAVVLGNAYGFTGDMAAAYEARKEALQACEASENIYLVMLARLEVAITLRAQGRLQETVEICQQQMQAAKENGLLHSRTFGWLLAVLGETMVELNNMDKALGQAKKGYTLAENSGDLPIIGWSFLCLIRVLFSKGDLLEAEEAIQKIEISSQKKRLPPWIVSQIAAWQARIHLAQNNLEAASQWVKKIGLDPERGIKPIKEIHYFLLSDYVVVARILIAQERLDEAIRLLEHLLEVSEAGSRYSTTIEIRILQALALQAAGKTDQALSRLEKAFAYAEPEGFIRIFVDEGPPMARLLYEALSHEIAPDYVQRLLMSFPVEETEKTNASQPHGPDSELIEPLSEREIEVLQLISQGLSNREVGDRLYLTLNTVKAHSRTIYSKLGVNNRTQAVSKARALGII